jgi:hypothetical protein
MRPQSRALISGLTVLAVLLGGGALAHVRTHHDPNDSPGILDLDELTMSHGDGKLRITIRTHGPWPTDEIYGPNYFRVNFDSRGDASIDFAVVVTRDGGPLLAYLLRESDAAYRGDVDLTRPDNRSVKLVLRKSRLDPRPGYIEWKVESQYEDSGTCQPACDDVAPDDGKYRHGF